MNHFDFDNRNINKKPRRIEFDDALYPERIKIIMGKKAPKHLDMVGNLDLLSATGLGFCGSRKVSQNGLLTTQDCAIQVAQENISIISGNAAGVDFEAHYNCLKVGGTTILVLPEGINHFRVKKMLQPVWDWDRVLVVSQFEPNAPWKTFRAMTRNQLIIALSLGMIIIEAGEKGGTLNAGKETLKFGLPLYVVQYEDMATEAKGNQLLIEMGAQKLSINETTNCANLSTVFDNVNENYILRNIPRQRKLF